MKKRPILNAYETKIFNEWIADGNAVEQTKGVWVEQSTQYRKKFTYEELQNFFKKEYLSYNGGGAAKEISSKTKNKKEKLLNLKAYNVPSITYAINPLNEGLDEIFQDVVGKDELREAMSGVDFVGNTATGTDAVKLLHLVGKREGKFKDGNYYLFSTMENEWSKDKILSKEMSISEYYKQRSLIEQRFPNWIHFVYDSFDYKQEFNLTTLYDVLNSLLDSKLLNKEFFGIIVEFKTKDGAYQVGFNAKIIRSIIKSLIMAGITDATGYFNTPRNGVKILDTSLKFPNKNKRDEFFMENSFGFIMPIMIPDEETLEEIRKEGLEMAEFDNLVYEFPIIRVISPNEYEIEIYGQDTITYSRGKSIQIKSKKTQPKPTPQSTTKNTDKKTALGNKLRKGMVVRIEYKESNGSTLSNDLFFDDDKFIKYILITDKKGKELSETEETLSESELNEYYKEYKEYIIDEFYENMADGGQLGNQMTLFNTGGKIGFDALTKKVAKRYAGGGRVERVLFAVKKGKPNWEEEIITTNETKFDEAKKWAESNGFDRFRIAEIDMSKKPKFKKGGKTISQTPAPKKDQIKGSSVNKEGSSKDLKSASKLKFSDDVIETLKNKVEEHNAKYPKKKITLDSAKAVLSRGMGAFSTSYRPTIGGGKKNSRVAWGLARLNAFIYKIINGTSKSGKYSQDNDLIEELGYKVKKFDDGGELESDNVFDATKLDLDKPISSKVYFKGVENEINKVLQNNYKPVYDFDKNGIEWVYKNTLYVVKDEDLILELKEALASRNRNVVATMIINNELPRIESRYGKDVNFAKKMHQEAKDFYQNKLRNEKSERANDIFIDYLILRLKENKIDKYENGGALKVGSKVGFLRPRTGRYEYAEVLSIDGDNVNLVVRHPKISQWDNYFTETKERITKFSNTLSEDYDRPVMKVKYAGGGVVVYKETDLNRRDGKTKIVQVTKVDSYREALERIEELKKNNKNPNVRFFTGDIYADGGWILMDGDTERKLGEYETESEARQMMYEYEGNSEIVEKSVFDKLPPNPNRHSPAFYFADGDEINGLITDEQVNDLSFKFTTKNVPLKKGVLLHEIVTLEEFDLDDEKNINFYPFHLIYGDSSLAIFDAFGVDEVAGLKRKDCEEFINNLKAQGKTEKDGSFMAGLTNYVGDKLFMFFNVARLSYEGFANRVLPHEALHLSRSLISILKNDWLRENLNTPNWWEDKRAVFVDMDNSNEEFFAETLERTTAIAMNGWYKVTGQKCVVEKKEFADGGKVLASSSSKEGINKLIEQYLYGSTITLVETDNDKIYEVHNKKGKTSFYVEFSRGKYKFIQPSKFVGGGKAIRQTQFAVYKLLDKKGLIKYFTDTDLEKFLEEWNEDYNTDYEDFVEFNEYEREFIIKPVFSKNDMGGTASQPSFLEIQINDVPNWENEELANYLNAPISLVSKNRNFYVKEVQNEMMLNVIPNYAGGGSAKKSMENSPLKEYYEKYTNGGFVGGDIIKFKYDGKDFTRKVESVDEMGNAIVNIMKTQKANVNPADVFEIKKEKDDKSIIIEKLGLNEKNANFLIDLSPTFAVWLADSIIDANTKITKEGLTREEATKLLNNEPALLTTLQERITGILDWLQHPTTRKQNLRELTFAEAERKSEEWHLELSTSGGDTNYVEPVENMVLIEYPENDNGVKYYWTLLPKTFCDIEGRRSGHCGTTRKGDCLISLRSVRPYTEDTTISDSHILVAYNRKEGVIYQTKGKNNAKPSKKYFPYIFDLIKMMASGQITEQYKVTQQEKIKELESEKNKIEAGVKKLQKYFESEEARTENVESLVEKASVLQEVNKKLENINSQIEKLNEESSFDFNGFGSEYQSFNDYGYEDITNEQVKELYAIKPDMFNDFAGQFMLYEAGLVDEAPNTLFTIEKGVDNVVDLLRVDRSTRDGIVKEVLSGETYDSIDARYYYDNAGDYVNELKGFGYDSVIDKIVEITGYDKEEVKENGAEYYLNGEDENFDSDSFDDIKTAIGNALAVATEDNYATYIRKQIESALEELGTIEKLDYTGVVLNIDLSKLMSIGEISSYMKEENTNDLEDVFYQVVELPLLDIDDRYEPYPDDWQEYFDINSYEEGGVIYQDLSKIKPMVVNDKTVLTEFELKKSKSDIEIETQIRSSDDVVNILRQLWEKDTINAYEQAYVLFLNTNNKVIGYYHHSSGGISGTIMEVQMISGMAVKSLAKGVIIAHNHPSGNRKPSDADEKITNQLLEALKLFNIKLLDSIILTESSYLSLADEGILK